MENSLNTNDYSLIILFKDSLIYENNNYLLLKKNTNNILESFVRRNFAAGDFAEGADYLT